MPDLPKGLQLEVIVREDAIEVADRATGVLQSAAERCEPEYDLNALDRIPALVKSKFPEKTDATILLGPDIAYDVLVQVMDTVRVYRSAAAPVGS